MYSRFLFVGLGGSGGKTLRFLKRELRQWQNEHGIDGPLPSGWQFVNIDTPAVDDGTTMNELVEPLSPGEYLGLIKPGLTFRAVQKNLDIKPEFHEEMATWRIDPSGVTVPLVMGAGQFRAIGQTVAMAYARVIHKRLRLHMDRLSMPEVEPQLGQVYRQVTKRDPGQISNVYIVVISSLAGGTGAGLLSLVCDIIRADGTVGDNIFALLYTPDVFQSLGGPAIGGVQPNTLATACELMNGYWRDNALNSRANPVLTDAGLNPPTTRSGPSFPFLVGRRNADGIDFGTPDRTFEMTGRSLVSWVTDSQVQSRFIAHTVGNWQSAAMTNATGPILVDEGGKDRGHPQFSALGFARVSVGTNYLENYTVQRLARDANEHLVDYNHRSDEAQRWARDLATADPEVISRKIADEHLDSFLSDAGLSEYGPDENQIIDALRPDDKLKEEFVQRAHDLAGIGAGDRRTVDAWMSEIIEAVDQAWREYSKNYRLALQESTNEWADAIQSRVLDAVERQVANLGLHVAKSICEVAAEHLKQAVHDDLRHEATTYRDWHSDWQRETRRSLEHISSTINADDPALEDAVRDTVHFASYIGDEHLTECAAELCPEVAERVLLPLAAALSEAHSKAIDDKLEMMSWPAWTDGSPPRSVAPPTGEFTLISVDEYPERFNDLLYQTFTKIPQQQRRREVRSEVTTGGFLKSEGGRHSEYNKSRCLSVLNNWWPNTKPQLDPARVAARLEVKAQTDIAGLTRRANRWLRRQGTPFARFLDLSIRSYLGSDAHFHDGFTAAQITAHLTTFITQVNGAIKASGPLVAIDAALLGMVHPDTAAETHKRYFSQIPLQGHPAEGQLRESLTANGVTDEDIKGILGNDGTLKYVDITTSLHSPHSVLVMKSLMDPIGGAWNKARNTPAARHSFWMYRRSMSLDKFVPVPQSLLLCMIRGWFTGILLGRIDRGNGSQPVIIARHGGGTPAKFPYPFLTPRREDVERLAQVMEVLGLAYVEVGCNSTLEPLTAYIELRELGRSDSDSDLTTYNRLNPALDDWVTTGNLSNQIVDPDPNLDMISRQLDLDSGGNMAYKRSVALSRLLQDFRSSYSRRYDRERSGWSNDPATLSDAPLWTDLWLQIAPALTQMSQACKDAAQRYEGSGDVII